MCIRDRIYTIHYFEYKSDFHFAGERHNFWEFQCVDKGKAEIETDNGIYHLTTGQLIFHRPNESVSYTHLDVYKRQRMNIPSMCGGY